MAALTHDDLRQRLARVELLVTDVDGVLTDGGIVYVEDGTEAKTFNVKDGSACYIAKLIGLRVVVVTARRSKAVERRFAELPVDELHQGVFDKLSICLRLQRELGLEPEQIAYLGDDLVDLAAMRHVGVAITVADGHARLREEAQWITAAPGGGGALREVVDAVVDARDLWPQVLADYFDRQGRD
jgi:3-deoxy-D-manno-octulosonate 8-phosphate phosphatase (KDO 8-P phosphatase)